MAEPTRGRKEALARVLEDPTRESFRDLLRDHTGEAPNLDFKEQWPSLDKLARHVLAFANSGGGCIVVGVAEQSDKTLLPTGLATLTDKVDVSKALNKSLPESLLPMVRIDDFAYDASEYATLVGKKFQLLTIESRPELLPFVCEKASADVRLGAIYVRRGTESVEGTHDDVQRLINERLATGHSTAAAMALEDHLEQLRVLEKQIPRTITVSNFSLARMAGFHTHEKLVNFLSGETKPNPAFPKEDVTAFVRRMFEAKKNLIAKELGIADATGARRT